MFTALLLIYLVLSVFFGLWVVANDIQGTRKNKMEFFILGNHPGAMTMVDFAGAFVMGFMGWPVLLGILVHSYLTA